MNDVTVLAKEIAKLGRGGDTILAHINPYEARVLELMGGAGTINPYTGLPEYRIRWRNIVRAVLPVAAIVVAIAAPQLIPTIGQAIVGASAPVAAQVAAGAAIVNGSITLAVTGDLEAAARSAATAAVTAGTSAAIQPAVNSALINSGIPAPVANVVASTTSAAAGAAATGQDINAAMTNAAITSTATTAYREITAPTPELTRPAAPPPTTTPSGEPIGQTDYSLAAGLTTPGQGLRAPALAPLPAAETIGQTPIDYGNIFTPSVPSTGFQTPTLRELPSAEQIGRTPIDYRETLTPETRNLPEMGGGTGVTARDSSGGAVQLSSDSGSALRRAGEEVVRGIARDYAGSLYDQPSRTSASTLASTGLFQPISVVPTSTTGIAPVARGKPIFGGEDEEASGSWGSRTLRG